MTFENADGKTVIARRRAPLLLPLLLLCAGFIKNR
jgi:hypothetical protein